MKISKYIKCDYVCHKQTYTNLSEDNKVNDRLNRITIMTGTYPAKIIMKSAKWFWQNAGTFLP